MTDAELTLRHQILSGYLDTKPGQGPKELQDAIMAKLFHPSTVWAVIDYLAEKQITKAQLDAMPEFKAAIDEQMAVGHHFDTSFEFAYRTGKYQITKENL